MIGFGITLCSNYFYGRVSSLCIERRYPSFFPEWLLKMKVNMWLQNKKVLRQLGTNSQRDVQLQVNKHDAIELCAFTAILHTAYHLF